MIDYDKPWKEKSLGFYVDVGVDVQPGKRPRPKQKEVIEIVKPSEVWYTNIEGSFETFDSSGRIIYGEVEKTSSGYSITFSRPVSGYIIY